MPTLVERQLGRAGILRTKAVCQVPSTMKQDQRSWTEEAREGLGRSISIENPSVALVNKCMAAATYGLNFDIAEIWRFLPDSGGHNLGGNKGIGSGSTLSPIPAYVYAQPATLRTYTGRIAGIWNSSFEDSQAPKQHVLSPSLCVQARASGCPLWFVSSESEKLHPSLPLNTAVVLPVPLEGDSTGDQEGSYVAVFLSLKGHERNMLSLQFLENISKAATRLLVDQRKVKERLESISEVEPVLNTLPDVPAFHLGERINMGVKRAELSQLDFLVSGSRWTIHTAVYKGKKVVVKSARTDVQDASMVRHELELEMQLLQRIRHNNVVALLGVGTELGLFLILERMENGSLAERLKDDAEGRGKRGRSSTKPFTYMELLRRGRQLAEALRYLHEEAIPGHMIVHRDLKPDNVGFTAEGDLKVLDLGLARIVVKSDMENATYEMTGNTGSERYMAPEVAESFEYNEKVDVYSFGLVLWTMYTLKKPFAGMDRDEFKEKVVRVGVRPILSKKWPRPLADLMRDCWAMKMEERPSFVEVCVRLQDMLQQGIDKNLHEAAPRRGVISKFLKNRNSVWF